MVAALTFSSSCEAIVPVRKSALVIKGHESTDSYNESRRCQVIHAGAGGHREITHCMTALRIGHLI